MIKIRSLSHAEVNSGVLLAVTFCRSRVNDEEIRSLSHAEVNRGVLLAVTFCRSRVNDDKNSFTFSR